MSIVIENWGEIDYREAHLKQLQYVSEIYSGDRPETLVICSHPPVVTLGKKSIPSDLIGWSGDVYEIERGGKATYHGPSQIVMYPILDLRRRGQNIAGFLTAMETAMVRLVSDYSLVGEGNPDRGQPDYTGVWVGGLKLASIGVAVKRWVTYHGLAFNLIDDPLAFTGINPCGLTTKTMTSLEALLGNEIDRSQVENRLVQYLISELNSLLSDTDTIAMNAHL